MIQRGGRGGTFAKILLRYRIATILSHLSHVHAHRYRISRTRVLANNPRDFVLPFTPHLNTIREGKRKRSD